MNIKNLSMNKIQIWGEDDYDLEYGSPIHIERIAHFESFFNKKHGLSLLVN
ncbi:MAG: hypothetical protein Aureis2KO_15420 [Aureisphaera sp.]